MDDKLFDKIIKEKAESYLDSSRPSGADMSRLIEQLPPSANVSWFSSTTNRVVSLVATTLIILTIFLVYRTFKLERTIELLDERLHESSISGERIIYQYDTTAMDSLAQLSIELNNRVDSLLASGIGIVPAQHKQTNNVATLDAEAMADAVMKQLLEEIQSDPVLMNQIREQLGLNEEAVTEETISTLEDEQAVLTSEVVAKALTEEGLADDVLTDIASDPEKAKAIANLITGNDPEDEGAMGIGVSKEEIESMLDDRKEELLKDYLEYDPSSVSASVEKVGADNDINELMQEYMAVTPLERKQIAQTDSLARVSRLENLEEIREEQAKVRDRAILLGGGLGFGRLPIEGYESAGTQSFKLTAEYQPNHRFGFATGAEFYRSVAETDDISGIDLTKFEDLALENGTAEEVEVNLLWLDIPLEAKLYFKKGKFSPYAIVSIRARALLKESYTFEIDDEEDVSPSFESENTFVIPSYGYGLGTQFYLNPKLNGAIQLHHSIGGDGLGLSDEQFNTLQLQGIIYFDLK